GAARDEWREGAGREIVGAEEAHRSRVDIAVEARGCIPVADPRLNRGAIVVAGPLELDRAGKLRVEVVAEADGKADARVGAHTRAALEVVGLAVAEHRPGIKLGAARLRGRELRGEEDGKGKDFPDHRTAPGHEGVVLPRLCAERRGDRVEQLVLLERLAQ